MNPLFYGRRRAVSHEFRLEHLETGQKFILYPGQLKDFCRKHNLNYDSLLNRRYKYPEATLLLYPNTSSEDKAIHFRVFPASLAQTRP